MSRIPHSRRLRRIQSARCSASRKIQTPHAKEASQTAAESSQIEQLVPEGCRPGQACRA